MYWSFFSGKKAKSLRLFGVDELFLLLYLLSMYKHKTKYKLLMLRTYAQSFNSTTKTNLPIHIQTKFKKK